MAWFKHIAMVVLSLSIIAAGFPAMAAKPECPMAKMMHKMAAQDKQDKKQDCCAKMAQKKQKKSGCCDDAACNAKCSAINSSVSMNLPVVKAGLPSSRQQSLRFFTVDTALAFQHLNTQERPPKSLA